MSNKASSTLHALKQAIKQKGDFPAEPETLQQVLSAMREGRSSDDQIANLVLSDFALTQKVLRLANTPMYAAFGPIATVATAIYVLGNDTLGHVALDLQLLDEFDELGNHQDNPVVQQELENAVMAGALARKLGTSVAEQDTENLAEGTLLKSLGKLLVCVYLPEQFKKIQDQSNTFDKEAELARDVLGLTFEEIAAAVTHEWALPGTLVDDVPSWKANLSRYALHYVALTAKDAAPDELDKLAQHYAPEIGLDSATLLAKSETAITHIKQYGVSAEEDPLRLLTALLSQLKAGAGTSSQVLQESVEALYTGFGCTRVLLFLRNKQTPVFNLLLGKGDAAAQLTRKLAFDLKPAPDIVQLALSRKSAIYIPNSHQEAAVTRIPAWLKAAITVDRTLLLVPLVVRDQPAGLFYLDWPTVDALSPPNRALSNELVSAVGQKLSQLLK